MSRPISIKPGDKFNKLTFLEESDIKFNSDWVKIRYGMFECECGKTKELRIHLVKSGNTMSCGCARYGKKKGVNRKFNI
jgi:hypothetical protein